MTRLVPGLEGVQKRWMNESAAGRPVAGPCPERQDVPEKCDQGCRGSREKPESCSLWVGMSPHLTYTLSFAYIKQEQSCMYEPSQARVLCSSEKRYWWRNGSEGRVHTVWVRVKLYTDRCRWAVRRGALGWIKDRRQVSGGWGWKREFGEVVGYKFVLKNANNGSNEHLIILLVGHIRMSV